MLTINKHICNIPLLKQMVTLVICTIIKISLKNKFNSNVVKFRKYFLIKGRVFTAKCYIFYIYVSSYTVLDQSFEQ